MKSNRKTDNEGLRSKLELRRFMLRRHHADGDIRVFDCCQGSGILWGRLRSEFATRSYWGVDVKPRRGRLRVDSRRVIGQADLRCNVIDIDTYGMPWDHWLALLPAVVEPTTVFLTVGLVKMRGVSLLSTAVRDSLGIPRDWNISPAFTDELVRLSLSRFLSMPAANGLYPVEAWESTRGRRARYLAVRIDRPARSPGVNKRPPV